MHSLCCRSRDIDCASLWQVDLVANVLLLQSSPPAWIASLPFLKPHCEAALSQSSPPGCCPHPEAAVFHNVAHLARRVVSTSSDSESHNHLVTASMLVALKLRRSQRVDGNMVTGRCHQSFHPLNETTSEVVLIEKTCCHHVAAMVVLVPLIPFGVADVVWPASKTLRFTSSEKTEFLACLRFSSSVTKLSDMFDDCLLNRDPSLWRGTDEPPSCECLRRVPRVSPCSVFPRLSPAFGFAPHCKACGSGVPSSAF